jgi:pimeloyl-ACP methyl ester carboxylesterase
MNNKTLKLFIIAISGILLLSCSKMDNMLLFTGANPLTATEIDTSLLYTDLRNNPELQWRIFSISAPKVSMDCFLIQKDSSPVKTSSARVILFFNGNDISFWDNYGEWECLSSLGADFMTIDYRGYGRTLGKFAATEQSCYEDAERALVYLIDSLGYSEDSVSLFGFSLGTGVAIEMAKRHRTSHTALFAPFTSIETAANGITGGYNIPSYWLLNSLFDNISKIADISQPLFIIAGKEDMLFPPQDNAVKLFNKANKPKHLMILPGFGHPKLIAKSFSNWKDSVSIFLGGEK